MTSEHAAILSLTERERAVLSDALNDARHHLEEDDEDGYVADLDSLEQKLTAAGLLP